MHPVRVERRASTFEFRLEGLHVWTALSEAVAAEAEVAAAVVADPARVVAVALVAALAVLAAPQLMGARARPAPEAVVARPLAVQALVLRLAALAVALGTPYAIARHPPQKARFLREP